MRRAPLKRLHVSWIVASFSLGIIVGVVVASGLPGGLVLDISWLLVGLVVALFAFFKPNIFTAILVVLAGFSVGLWRGGIDRVGLDAYENIIGQTVEISGVVSEDPDIDKRGKLALRLKDVKAEGVDLPGSVWATSDKTDAIKRSDRVTLEGKITEGFGPFSASIYRAKIKNVERQIPGDVAVGVRDWFADLVRQHLPEVESALGLGFLMGLRRALPPELSDALKIAGLTHVIVASGYNLTILVRLSRRLFVKISKYLATVSSVAMILGFMAMTGMSPSMSRAGLVAGVSLAIWYFGRKIHPFVLLSISAATTLLINPQYGWGDLGWQLSFASFAGVIILAPLLQAYFFGDKEPGTVRQIFGETFSAQIMTLPILVMAFGEMSNVALIANILILPLVPLAMLLTFLVGIFANLPVIASLIAAPTELLLSYMVKVAEWLSSQQWAQTELEFGWLGVIATYAVLAFAMWWMDRQTKLDLRDTNVVD